MSTFPFVGCSSSGVTTMRNCWGNTGLWVVVIAVLLVVVYWIGVLHGMDVEAFNRNMVAEGDYTPQLCGDTWVVQRHDRAWDIAGYCYGTDRTGQYVHEIARANPGVDIGRLSIGQVLVLPERGRR